MIGGNKTSSQHPLRERGPLEAEKRRSGREGKRSPGKTKLVRNPLFLKEAPWRQNRGPPTGRIKRRSVKTKLVYNTLSAKEGLWR